MVKRKYLWLVLGVVFFACSFFVHKYFFEFIFLGSLGILGYFVYDALEFIYYLNARHLDDMRANMEIIMQEREINKDSLIHRKLHKDTKQI